MAEVIWGRWQVRHIARRHGVTGGDFDQAWHDPHREDFQVEVDVVHGECMLSHGFTNDDRLLEMLWRFQEGDPSVVFPITAYFPKDAEEDKS